MPKILAGAAEVDITPLLDTPMAGGFAPRRVKDVHDPLYARAVVLDHGGQRVALVCLDVIDVMQCDVDAIRRVTSTKYDLPPQHVLVAATHTHTGPSVRIGHGIDRDEAYCAWMVQRVADAVGLAVRRLSPAKVGWGRGELHGISFCRRYRMRDGSVRMNPGRANPDIVAPTSCVDPDVPVLYLATPDGEPLGCVVAFSLHYVGTDDPEAASADYFGHFACWMKRFFGETFVPLLFNGASGQINNVNPWETNPDTGHARAQRVAAALAGEVIKVIHLCQLHQEVSVASQSMRVQLPRKKITDEDLKIAKAILRGDPDVPQDGPFSWVVGHAIPHAWRRVYAAECLRMAAAPSDVTSEVQALRIGETVWVGLPGDAFVEIGRAIKLCSRATVTGIISHANDNLGYLATDRALLEEGGYETWGGPTFFTGPGTEKAIVQAASKLLAHLSMI